MVRHVLSLAGGGIRGTITASFLEQLEKFLIKYTQKTLYETFDVYTGSSTGALIASSIAYKGMTAREISQKFYTHETAKEIMNKSWIDSLFGLFQTRPKYDGIGKRNLIKRVCGDIKCSETDKDVIIPIYDITLEDPVIVKSWETEKFGNNYQLANILDATSAAPGFFPSVEYIPGKWAIDGSIISHNPSLMSYINTKKLYPDEKVIVVSIGTGQGYPKKIGNSSMFWGAIEWATEGNLFDIFLNAPMEAEVSMTRTLCTCNGDKFIHVDGMLKHTTMDDISEENLERLRKIGRDLWYQNKHHFEKLFLPTGVEIEHESIFL